MLPDPASYHVSSGKERNVLSSPYPPDMRDRLSSLMSFLVTLDDVLHRLFYLYAMPNGRQNGLYLDSPLAAPPHQLP